MVSEFPSNSYSRKDDEKPEPKKVERVTQGEVIRRKKSLGTKFKETFGGGDAKGVWSYVMLDVAIPAFKDLIVDAGQEALRRMILGESASGYRRSGASRSGGQNGFVSYNRYSPNTPRDGRREEARHNPSRRARANHDFDEIILPTRVEAEEVVDRLFDLVAKYDQATISDLYDLVGVSGNFTDEKYGWTDIRGAGVTRIRNGYLLDLPKPEILD